MSTVTLKNPLDNWSHIVFCDYVSLHIVGEIGLASVPPGIHLFSLITVTQHLQLLGAEVSVAYGFQWVSPSHWF